MPASGRSHDYQAMWSAFSGPETVLSTLEASTYLSASQPFRSGSGTPSACHPIQWVTWSRCTSACSGTGLSNSTTSPPSGYSEQGTLGHCVLEMHTARHMLLSEAGPAGLLKVRFRSAWRLWRGSVCKARCWCACQRGCVTLHSQQTLWYMLLPTAIAYRMAGGKVTH